MKKHLIFFLWAFIIPGFFSCLSAQTAVPNGGFETWTNYGSYENPLYWDTPNQEVSAIPFFGTTVVTKSTDHYGGSYSARLETKHITLPPLDVPGFVTLGNLTINITSGTYTLTGGVPINDQPTHLKGYYKFTPNGGDSCVIAIGLFKRNGPVRDTVAYGYFSTHDTITDWTLFVAWIDYTLTEAPDSMNIFAISTAQETMHAGTVLYVDDIALDYTTAIDEQNPSSGIDVYNDRETQRLIVFLDFKSSQWTSVSLYDLTGRKIREIPSRSVQQMKEVLDYNGLPHGLYILKIMHDMGTFSKKFLLNF